MARTTPSPRVSAAASAKLPCTSVSPAATAKVSANRPSADGTNRRSHSKSNTRDALTGRSHQREACDASGLTGTAFHVSDADVAAQRAVSAAARSARRRLDAVVRRLTLGHSCVADGLTDSCGSFGTSRIYDHDSPALPNQVEDATGHRFPSIWRDSLRVHRWKLVHDKASIVASHCWNVGLLPAS